MNQQIITIVSQEKLIKAYSINFGLQYRACETPAYMLRRYIATGMRPRLPNSTLFKSPSKLKLLRPRPLMAWQKPAAGIGISVVTILAGNTLWSMIKNDSEKTVTNTTYNIYYNHQPPAISAILPQSDQSATPISGLASTPAASSQPIAMPQEAILPSPLEIFDGGLDIVEMFVIFTALLLVLTLLYNLVYFMGAFFITKQRYAFSLREVNKIAKQRLLSTVGYALVSSSSALATGIYNLYIDYGEARDTAIDEKFIFSGPDLGQVLNLYSCGFIIISFCITLLFSAFYIKIKNDKNW